jgi:dihydroneopterin aldolase
VKPSKSILSQANTLVASKTKIEIFDLHCAIRIGCVEEERSKPQDIAFDIAIYFDARLPCQSDKLEDTIDYMAIRHMIKELAETQVFHLLEKFSAVCINRIFEKFSTAQEIHFKIKKFSTMPDAHHVGFSLEAHRPS